MRNDTGRARPGRMILCAMCCAMAWVMGCAYSFKTTLPEQVKAVSVAHFDNKTFEVGLESRLVDKIIEEFAVDGRVKISDSQPDARLEGTITKYSRQAVSYGSTDGVYEFVMQLEAQFSCKDLKTGENLAGPTSVKTSISHQVFGSLASSEKEAQDKLAADLAKEIVHEVLMGW